MTLLLLSVSVTLAQETTEAAPEAENGLIVAQVLPADGTVGVETDATITVIFNRPVVPLGVPSGVSEDAGSLPQPLTFAPAVAGTGAWLNTSIYVFQPDPALAGGTEYTVTVGAGLSAGLSAADGSTLGAPFAWSFTTAVAAISEVVPTDGSADVRLDSTIQVSFNQPMDQASVEASFRLHTAESATSVPGRFTWADDGAGFMFEPDDGLAIATRYVAELSTPPLSEGGAALEGQMAWGFSTVPLPAVVSTDPFDGQTDAYAGGGFTIYFASPMNPETLEDQITIEPEPFFEFDNYYSDYSNSYTVSFASEPSTDYTITLAAGMEDVYGNAIGRETVIEYTTAPYDPDVSLQVPGEIGFYNSENAQTQLFLTHRNVSAIDLALYRVALEDFISAATGDQYYNAAANVPAGVSNQLRRWTIPSVAPLDQRRYELLNLGDTGVDCPGALESHLYVGANAIVVSDPDPVRARASAPDGEILDALYKDYALRVTGGPICANEILWWEVTLRDGRTAWVAEGVADGSANERFLDLRGAEAQTPIPLTQENGDALTPGIYLLTANAPELNQIQLDARRHIMVVANANLTLKMSVDSLLVWATDVNTGEPIPDAPITVYDLYHHVVGEGRTDADGVLRIEFERVSDLNASLVAVLQSDAYFGVGVTLWSDGIDPYYFGLNTNYYPEAYRVYLYTERPIYRPDQPVYFRGVVRAQDDVNYSLPPFETIPV
ncbi:MAG: Ig-like domain-containing protein, partial [Chloroflexota bacterium]